MMEALRTFRPRLFQLRDARTPSSNSRLCFKSAFPHCLPTISHTH